MKRNKLLLMCLLALAATATSCKSDEPEPAPTPDIEVVEPEELPTEDQMKMNCQAATYVFQGNYAEEGAAVLRRIAVRASALDESTKAVLMTKETLNSLSDHDAEMITRIYLRGGCLIVADASAVDVVTLWQKMQGAFDAMEEAHTLPGDSNRDAVNNIRNYNPGESEGAAPEGSNEPGDVIAVGCHGTYVTAQERPMKISVADKDGNPVPSDSIIEVAAESIEKHTEYFYGNRADRLVEWVNEVTLDTTDKAAAMKQMGNSLLASRGEKISLCDIMDSHMVQYDVEDEICLYDEKHKKEIMRQHSSMTYYIKSWSAYSFDDKVDYYAVDITVLLRNSSLGAHGNEDEETWNVRLGDWWRYFYYGFYMSGMKSVNPIRRATPPYTETGVSVVQAYPEEQPGSTTVTSGVNYSINGSFGISNGAGNGGVSGGVTFVNQTSRSIPDVYIEQQTIENFPVFTYTMSKHPKTHWTGKHDIVPRIFRNDTWTEQAWVWKISKPSGSYILQNMTEYDIEAVRGNLSAPYYFKDTYFTARSVQTVFYPLPTPPRYKSEWRMGYKVEGDRETVDNFLSKYYSKTWYPEFTSYGADADNAADAACDDFRTFITTFVNDRINWQDRIATPITFWVKKNDSPDVALTATVDAAGNVKYE